MPSKKSLRFAPGRTILISILSAICIGTLLLLLPASRTVPISFIDLFFTATSVTCVTGLLTVPLNNFTPFGHVIILILMQIGGLGLITLSIFIMSLFIRLGLTTQLLAGQVFELESWKNIKGLLFFIFKLTFILELMGTVIIFVTIKNDYSFIRALFLSLFHAVSAFCAAGLSLFPHSMVIFNHNPTVLLTISFLMLFGGLGFITWHELFEYAKSCLEKKRRRNLSLYSKIVLSTSSFITVSAAVLYWMLERNNTFHAMSTPIAILNTLFNAIASRGAGFTTVIPTEMHVATLFVVMMLAFIGSSPGSTGSGIKTTTFAIFIATIKTAILNKSSVELKGRRIAKDQIYKALAIISLSIAWILLTTFCLLITESSWEFFDILFEVVSAFATLGMSTGITPFLSPIGKVFIIASMIIGRLGSLTALLALQKRREKPEYEYPEERVMLG
jgi:trk/ktr system potassium uptake protein